MSTRPYTVLLGTVSGSANQLLPVFTAEPGYVTVIRDIIGWGTGVGTAVLQIIRTTGTIDVSLLRVGLADRQLFHVELRQVIPAGERVSVYCELAQWELSFTGYELVDTTTS